MSSPAQQWLVLLDQPRLADPSRARDCIGAILNMNRIDAMVTAKHAYGILVEGVGQGQATQLVRALAENGVAAQAVGVPELPDPIPGSTVHNADAVDRGLSVQGLHGEEKGTVPWDRVAVVSVGSIPQGRQAERTYRDAYQPIGRGSGMRLSRHASHTQYREQPPEMRVHVVVADPPYDLRFVEQRMNYDYLGERLQSSSSGNFRTFVLDLVAFSRQARVTDATRSFLDRARPPRHEFRDENEFARYNRWQLCMAILGRQAPDG